MNITALELKREEQAAFELGSLYRKFGYSQYKMSKFEEYDLYVRNKDFLISDSVITFTDTNGKLLALKPDVTLSIIKNSKDDGELSRVYYNENVYRVSSGTHSYKEIMQVGLECIGNIDLYNLSEVVLLASESLMAISPDCVLDISHMGILASLLSNFNLSFKTEKEIMRLIGEKNTHEVSAILSSEGVSDEDILKIKQIISLHGAPSSVMPRLKEILCDNASLCELEALLGILEDAECSKIINIDFSVINDMSYYNGIVFKGFIKGIPSSVLSGGQYDNLMSRMNRKSGAIGFAVYLDLLENLSSAAPEFDCDILVLYDENSDMKALSAFVREKTSGGARVKAEKAIPQKLRFKELYKISKGKVECLENNA